ncbi:hypothetical protein SELMODRAFT_416622 [Selaginella moellendorffii]|uniref:Uncharacterized protein n=1 Tax=Selaginella moellendorffii TaxID=88036 RepID=D8RZW3_SELML|nr:hypothetical protein SELMODRAFT_416622 [Selaginella moellendorffii]
MGELELSPLDELLCRTRYHHTPPQRTPQTKLKNSVVFSLPQTFKQATHTMEMSWQKQQCSSQIYRTAWQGQATRIILAHEVRLALTPVARSSENPPKKEIVPFMASVLARLSRLFKLCLAAQIRYKYGAGCLADTVSGGGFKDFASTFLTYQVETLEKQEGRRLRQLFSWLSVALYPAMIVLS